MLAQGYIFAINSHRSIWDVSAKAFFAAIAAEGISLDIVHKLAINNFIISLKANNLWDRGIAIYLMVGGVANACKYNLKDPRDADNAYRLTFYNSPTIDQDGVAWNGINQYANTYVAPGVRFTDKTATFFYYSISQQANGLAKIEIGAGDTSNRYALGCSHSAPLVRAELSDNGAVAFNAGTTNTKGLYLITRSNTTVYGYRNGVSLGSQSQTPNATANNLPLALGARNGGATRTQFTDLKCGCAGIIDGYLSPSEAVTYSSIVNSFMTDLGRNTY